MIYEAGTEKIVRPFNQREQLTQGVNVLWGRSFRRELWARSNRCRRYGS